MSKREGPDLERAAKLRRQGLTWREITAICTRKSGQPFTEEWLRFKVNRYMREQAAEDRMIANCVRGNFP